VSEQRFGKYEPGLVAKPELVLKIIKPLMLGALDTLITEIEIENMTSTVASEINKSPVVHTPQHISYLDTFVIPLAFRRAGLRHPYFATGSNLMVGIMGVMVSRLVGCFPVDRERLASKEAIMENIEYARGLREFFTSKLRKGESVLFFPAATRSRNGLPDYALGDGLSIFSGAMRAYGKENPDLVILVSAATYDFNPDIPEFEEQAKTGQPQPHRGFVDTFSSYMESNWAMAWIRAVTGRPLDALVRALTRKPKTRPFGKAYVVFSEPMKIRDYNISELRREVYMRMKESVVVTDTSLVMTALADRDGLSREGLAEIVEEWHEKLVESGTRVRAHSKSSETIEYAEEILVPRGVLSVRNGVYTAREFPASYFRNNIAYHLERANILQLK
jgi:glycerol-3-phosphate O-acyltransferase